MAQDKDQLTADKPSRKKAAGRKTARLVADADIKRTMIPVVGLGASAGGLEALESFFKAMPANSHAAFVIVSHLDPQHVSLMPELLQKHTAMPVKQVVDGTKVESDHVYIIPPNKDLSILNGTLQLMELMQPHGRNLPIDNFFRSLAQDQGANAIGIILSGTGSDGTIGMKAIKAEVGMTMVQSEASAKYDGMPRSAIATRVIDYILPAEQMPAQLIAYLKHAKHIMPVSPGQYEGVGPDALQKIFIILRTRTNHDFSLYKKNTICRRIERRMHVHQLDNIADYVRYLQESENEADILFNELLIGVTNFFRDPEAFESLRNNALMDLLADKPDDYSIRIWITGCSSGEEAYSIAILLLECMEALKRHFSVQVFATDIDENAISVARIGVYPASILADVSEERLRRFFTKEEDGRYRIRKNVREMLVFAPQNLIKDPPFTKLDLLCCRNLLIYLGPELQKKLLPLFHYSLRPEGILFLGSSETIGQNTDDFKALDKKWKIFRALPSLKKDNPALQFPLQSQGDNGLKSDRPDSIQKLEEISAFQMVDAILQQSDAPPCVIINEACDILYIHGKTGRFLEPAEGKVTINIIDMARMGLKKELTDAIRKVALHRQEVLCKGLHIPSDGGQLSADLRVTPIMEPGAMRGMIMVAFEESAGQERGRQPHMKPVQKKQLKSVDELAQELQYTRENLQSTIEELETANEELKSTNEELQSTNEELQSTNEELETSKEELQSLNEESATVNTELQSRIDDLSDANDDMKNLLDSTEIATVFLDTDMCIRRFTPRITDIIPLAGSDAGRPLSNFATIFVNADLADDAEQVLNDLIIREKELASKDGSIYLVRLRPYRTVGNVIDGVVVTFEDISKRKQMEKDLRRQVKFSEGIVRTIREPLLVLDAALRVVSANPSFYKAFAVNESETKGQHIYALGNGQWDIPKLRELLEDILPSRSSFEDFRVDHTFEAIGQRSILINASRINAEAEAEAEEFILLVMADVTADKQEQGL